MTIAVQMKENAIMHNAHSRQDIASHVDDYFSRSRKGFMIDNHLQAYSD